ncbi:aspartate aminotransferase family protein [Streptomyces sp. NPDC004126]|uniref:aminotransferase family protein n=1 Tax=Streptomyces sp. NPDC004126 TaxID=3390695 RepID=UPI003D07D633
MDLFPMHVEAEIRQPVEALGGARTVLPRAIRASGVRIYDDRGNDYIDGSSGPICVNIGHAVPEVLAAMRAQAESLPFVHRSQFSSPVVDELTNEVLCLAGDEFREVVYTNSGSEATETALRLVMHHHAALGRTDRTVVLSQSPSYHGMTAGALSVSGHAGRKENLAPLHDSSVTTVPVTATTAGQVLPGIEEWEAAFERVGPQRVAAVIVEPVGGAASGAAELPDEVFRRLRELCSQHGALLISDEVMTGFGRVGGWFGFEQSGVVPDLVVTGKGLSAGYTPIGACLVGRRVLEGTSAVDLAFGHTMSGNPLSAATALAVLRFTRSRRLPEKASQMSGLMRQRLAELSASFEFLGGPRGRGLLHGLPVLQDPKGFETAPLARLICCRASENGLILYPAGTDHRTQSILVAPPLTIGCCDTDLLFRRLHAALRRVEAELQLSKEVVR